ncbi:MAG: sigma-70 family RNA polymerase sigma factor [Polyangiaceae bacterium]|nr:sigma-70 family RNA polymerase sigma factor [Polyangiaceae bacterium]
MDAPKVDELLADPELRRFLLDFVKRRVSAADADDIVQTVLCDALVAKNLPSEKEELRKYLLGIARHKVVDAHRRTSREEVGDPPELVANPPPVEEESLLRWAEKQAPTTEEAQKTLSWMAREGEGEKLENIAADERVPAARVRQRVSRMRRWMKERWIAELAAVAALGVLALVLWRILRQTPDGPEIVKPDVTAEPLRNDALERAKLLRAEAIKSCDEGAYDRCLKGLDEAKQLDPAGDMAQDVVWARKKANLAREPQPTPAPTTSEKLENSPDSKSDPKSTDLKAKPAPVQTNVGPVPKSRPKPSPKGKLDEPTFEEKPVFQKKGGFEKK